MFPKVYRAPDTPSMGGSEQVFIVASGDDVTLPEGFDLASATFVPAGPDLMITGADGSEIIIADYFMGETPPALIGADGYSVSGEDVAAMTGANDAAPTDDVPSPTDGLSEIEALSSAESHDPIGRVTSLTGEVSVLHADGTREILHAGMPLFAGDEIETGLDSGLGILLIDGTSMSMAANGHLVLDEAVFDPSTQLGSASLTVQSGVFTIFSEEATVSTPEGKISVKGSQFGVDLSGSGVIVVMMETSGGNTGMLTFANDAGILSIRGAYESLMASSMTSEPVLNLSFTHSTLLVSFGVTFAFLPAEVSAVNDYGLHAVMAETHIAPDGLAGFDTTPSDDVLVNADGETIAGFDTASGGVSAPEDMVFTETVEAMDVAESIAAAALGEIEVTPSSDTDLNATDFEPHSDPVAAPEAEPELVVDAESELESEAEAELEPEVELEAEPEPEAVQDAEPESEPEAEAEAEPEPELVVEAEAELEPEVELEAEPEPEAVQDAEPELEAEAEPEAEPELVVEAEAELEPEVELEAEPEPEAVQDAEPELEAEAEPEAEPELVVNAEAELEPEVELEAEPEPEAVQGAEPELEAEAEPEAEPELVVNAEAELEPEVELEAEPEPEAVQDAEPEVDPEAEAEAAPEPVVNTPPTAELGAVITGEDNVYSGQLTATDLEEGALTFGLSEGGEASHGTVNISSDGGFAYTPSRDFSGEDTFTYQVSDDAGNVVTATITVTINPVVDVPVLAVANSVGTEDAGIALVIAAAMPAGTTETIASLTLSGVPEGATLSVGTDNGDGSWNVVPEQVSGLVLTPPENFGGTISLSVTATSSDGGTASQSFEATVTPVVDQPTLTVSDVVIDVLPPSGEDLDGTKDDDVLMGTSGADEIDGGQGDDEIYGSPLPGEDEELATLDEFRDVTLNVNAALADVDGSEALSIEISGVPEGAVLSLGMDVGDGTWTLAETDLEALDSLVMTLPQDLAKEDFTLKVTATSVELDTDEISTANGTIDVNFETSSVETGDQIFGGKGDDDIFGGFGDDVLDGGQGDDALSGGTGDDTLIGDKGDDQLAGGQGDDTLSGGKGEDVLEGGVGDDVLEGGLGEDAFIFKAGDGDDIILDLSEKEELRFEGPEFSAEELVVHNNGDETSTLTFGAAANVSVTLNDTQIEPGRGYSVSEDDGAVVITFDDGLGT